MPYNESSSESIYDAAPADAPAPINDAGGFSACGCMKVEAKTANDAVFLAAAKKMVVCSYGVLGWVIATTAGPYITMFAMINKHTQNGDGGLTDNINVWLGTDAGQEVAQEGAFLAFEVSFVYITFLALFMILPMCSPCCVVPACAYCAAKHQDRGMLKFVVCQHGTAAISPVLIVLYAVYRMVAEPVHHQDPDEHHEEIHTPDGYGYGHPELAPDDHPSLSWKTALFFWCGLLLAMHWCAFCAGVKAHGVLQAKTRVSVPVQVQHPMVPCSPSQPIAALRPMVYPSQRCVQ